MRMLALRTFSLVAFTFLVAWEYWKSFNIKKTEEYEIQKEMQQLRHFDEYSLVNEHLLTGFPQDIELAAIQRVRKQVVASHCHNRKRSGIFPRGSDTKRGIHVDAFRHILVGSNGTLLRRYVTAQVSDKHQLLYCVTPKVACTNWKRILLILDGYFKKPEEIQSSLAHNFSTGYFKRLSDYSPDEINLRLTTYYKFLFARHPIERLASAFRNKFIDAKYKNFKIIYGKYIMRKYRDRTNRTTDRLYKQGEGLTFSEFVKFLLDSPLEDSDFWNEHWERIDRLCLPCIIQYDFVGKYESLKQDADYLLRTIDVQDKVQFPQTKISKTPLYMNDYLKTLTEETRKKLYNLYQHDFLLFNYEKPKIDAT